MPTLAERVSTSFAAWERRGRGWDVAEYPVALEPPFRPFFLLPEPNSDRRHIDDGKRPTLLSAFAERVAKYFSRSEQNTPEARFEEQAAFRAYACDEIVTRQVLTTSDFCGDSRAMAQLLPILTSGCHPLSLEMVGCAGKVTMQLAFGAPDAERLFGAVADLVPSVALVDSGDLLARAWEPDSYGLVVDFGYAEEFFLSLPGPRTFSIDPYALLVGALARAGPNETLCFQVLVERVQNPWQGAIRDAVISGDGKPLFIDAPEFVGAARQKTEGHLFATVVRIGASAPNEYRVLDLVRGAGAFFDQFARPENRLVPLDNSGYDQAEHQAALLRRLSFRTGMLLSGDELLSLVHFPDETVRSEALVRSELRTKALPDVARGHGTVLGVNEHRGQRETVTIGVAERLQHTMIVGASGTGKSKLLVNLIRQDMERGDGLAVLDPHGDLIEEVLTHVPDQRLADVVLFDPSDEEWPIGFNILAASSELERSILASDLVGIFSRLSTSWGDGMSTVLANAVLAVTAHPDGGTLIQLRQFLVDEQYRKAYLSAIPDPEVQFFWTREWPLIGARSIGPILTRLNTFLRPKLLRQIVGQRKPKLEIGSVVEGRKIFLAKLSQGLIGNENAYLLGSLLLSKFLQHALSRQRLSKDERSSFWLYLDEAGHFVTPSVAALLTEARKYGVGLHLAFQMLSQLRSVPQVESAVLGSAYTRVIFRVGDDDAKRLADGFSSFEAQDLKCLARGHAIARLGEAANDCNLRTAPVDAMPEPVAKERHFAAREVSRKRYAARAEDLAEAPNPMAAMEIPLGARDPAVAARRPAVQALPIPEAPPPIEPLRAPTKTSPTPEVKGAARPTQGRGGPEHKYLQHLIQRLGEERGFRSTIEEQVEEGQVDVVLRREDVSIACEISVTTDDAHELENVAKCIKAGFTQVWLVVTEKRRKERLTSRLSEIGTTNASCLAVEELVGFLERAVSGKSAPREKMVGGYRVKVNRKTSSALDAERREGAIAEVVARALAKKRNV